MTVTTVDHWLIVYMIKCISWYAFFAFNYLSCGSPHDEATLNHNRKTLFCIGIDEQSKEKHKFQERLITIWRGIQVLAVLNASKSRVREGFWATLPPAQLERNASFHKLNWGHTWHEPKRGTSHKFPHLLDGNRGGLDAKWKYGCQSAILIRALVWVRWEFTVQRTIIKCTFPNIRKLSVMIMIY